MPFDGPSNPEDLSRADRIDMACDRFESARKTQPDVDLRAFLADIPAAEHAALFTELLLIELEYRSQEDRPLSKPVLLAQYPEFAEQIEGVALMRGFSTTHTDHSRPPTQPVNRPRKLAHFELRECVGAGGKGEVWRAWDTKLLRDVAVKMPLRADLSDTEATRFLREGRTAARLQHPNIVKVYEAGHEDNTAYIVADFVHGESLSDWAGRVRPNPVQIGEICRKLAEALHHAHSQGVIHRDIKPANVLVDQNDEPFLTDFGLAKWIEEQSDLTIEGQLLGTFCYMAPEQAAGRAGSSDCRTDVYSLGVLLYELLTESRPFEGERAKLIDQILHDEPVAPRTINRSLPRDLQVICLKALEKHPDRRYATAGEMAADLRRFCSGEPILAKPPAAPERAWRWLKRRRAAVSTIALGALAIGLMLLVSRLSREKHALLGLQEVHLTTEPAGARVAFVPLDNATGAPDGNRRVRPRGRSPVTVELPPGDYLVVAALDDGRFHEVIRRVPKSITDIPEFYAHVHWTRKDGAIELSKVVIPDQPKLEQEIEVPGMQTEENRNVDDSASFYFETCEFSIARFRKLFPNASQSEWKIANDGIAIAVSFDHAVSIAERSGLRLPSEREYETAIGYLRSATRSDSQSDLVSIALESTQNVVAEWTTTCDAAIGSQSSSFPERRFARGAIRNPVNAKTLAATGVGDERILRTRFFATSEVGFRCVRSAAPRFLGDRP